jgi:tRNA A-37 threonylcarbamoyl transferase component Bud32
MNDSANQVKVPLLDEQTGEPQCSPDDCGPGSEAVKSVQKHFCCRDGTLPGASEQLSAEDQTLLRRRLLAISALSLVGHSLNFFQGLFVGEPYLLELTIPLVILTAGVVLLAGQFSLSYRQLRRIELVIFGGAVVYFAYINYLLTLHSAQQGNEVMTAIGLDRTVTSFFALMICYGMFIPNTWKRAMAVILPMAVTPATLTLYFTFGSSAVTPILRENASPEYYSHFLMVLVFGAFVSVFGSHIIHTVRKEAAKEKELGMYQLKERIGAGGMGEVWKAEHTLLARPAAIKMIQPEKLRSSNGEPPATLRRRFELEAKATASLRSPHTVALYDFGITDNRVFYYVMEYLEGLDLDRLVQRFGPLVPERVVYLLQQAASSLSEAHQRRLIHRDLKPSNLHVGVMGLDTDFLKVLDFGLVKVETAYDAETTKLTQDGSTTGTPAFMAPELALRNRPIDERSDVYSLGCVAYWLLTGQLVFESASAMEMIVHHARAQPVPPSERTETEVPESLERTILACLEKDPDNRPQTMRDLSRRLVACDIEALWTQKRAQSWWSLHMPHLLPAEQ